MVDILQRDTPQAQDGAPAKSRDFIIIGRNHCKGRELENIIWTSGFWMWLRCGQSQ